jgi:microcystin degradation protein MlrC
MRIAIGGIEHETNTYADATSGTTPLRAFEIFRGDEMVAEYTGTGTTIGGMLAGCAETGAEAVPTFKAWAQPSGTIQAPAYSSMLGELCARLTDALPLDAVGLSLHGAGVAEGIDDLEADVCRAVRGVVGPNVPIAATFDLHGNPTQAMADVLDGGGFCFHLYPHTDMGERGREAVRVVSRVAAGELRPVNVVERLPILLPPSTTNFTPAARVNEYCAEVESRAGVIDCTFFHGFPFVDIPQVGSHIWVTTDGDPALARRLAREVARFVWDMREEFLPEVLSPDEAVARALQIGDGPVVINETNDNAGGGAPADGTHLLKAMLDARVTDACFGFICDPSVAHAAHAAGVGAELDVVLGGKTDDVHGPPLPLRVKVVALSDGRYTLRTWAPGMKMDHGPMARLAVDGIEVIVGSERSQTFEPGVFEIHGMDVTRYRIVALKSSQHFRAGFEPIAKAIVTSDAPGLTTLRPWTFPRSRTPRPIWPMDENAVYG